MMYFSIAFFLLAASSNFILSKAQTTSAPDLSSVTLQQIAYGGPGCPQGTLKFAELLNPWRLTEMAPRA
jgi:hypothetical protein